MATSTYQKFFRDANTNLPATGMNVWIIGQAAEFINANMLPLTEDELRLGLYRRAAVADGEYKIYVYEAGGATDPVVQGVLYDEHLWHGEDRITTEVDKISGMQNEIDDLGDEKLDNPFQTKGDTLAAASASQVVRIPAGTVGQQYNMLPSGYPGWENKDVPQNEFWDVESLTSNTILERATYRGQIILCDGTFDLTLDGESDWELGDAMLIVNKGSGVITLELQGNQNILFNVAGYKIPANATCKLTYIGVVGSWHSWASEAAGLTT